MKGGSSMLASSRLKLMFLKMGCCFTSTAPRPWQPSRSLGSLVRSWRATEGRQLNKTSISPALHCWIPSSSVFLASQWNPLKWEHSTLCYILRAPLCKYLCKCRKGYWFLFQVFVLSSEMTQICRLPQTRKCLKEQTAKATGLCRKQSTAGEWHT